MTPRRAQRFRAFRNPPPYRPQSLFDEVSALSVQRRVVCRRERILSDCLERVVCPRRVFASVMRWLWSFSRVYATVGVVFCVVLFAAMIISGQGLKSFIVLAAAAYWAVMARYDAQRVASPSRASQTSSRAHARRNLARAAPRRLTSGTRTAAITGMVLVGPRPCLSSRSPESQARELASPAVRGTAPALTRRAGGQPSAAPSREGGRRRRGSWR